MKLRVDGQFFNVFNRPNFGLPVLGYAGIPGKPATQTGFGALTFTTSPPTGLLGVGLGGDSSCMKAPPVVKCFFFVFILGGNRGMRYTTTEPGRG
jgi:hypothetical protein